MKNLLRISFFLAFFSASYGVFASTGYPEVSCSVFGTSANSCNQCFEGGTLYQGQYVTNMFDDFTAGNQQTAIFANNPGSVRTEYVQNGFTWSESASMWTLNSNLFSSFSATRGWYIALQPNQVASAYVSSAPGTGLQFISGPSSGGSRDIPSFKLTYDTTYYTQATGFVTPESHKECVFYKSNWCGDGVVDSAKEDCDLGSQNGVTGSSCPINCKLAPFDLSLKKYVLGQDAQNGSPVTVTREQTIDYTFQARNNGTSATTGRTTVADIALPAGVNVVSVTGAGWTCSSTASSFSCYTDTIFQSGVNLPLITVRAQVSNTAVYGSPLMNYACVQNGNESRINNFGNNNCDEANIIITPPNPAACVPGTTTGNQVNPINGASPGLCPAGKIVGDFVATPTGSTLVYSWSCDGSAPGGLCQATYTPGIGICTPGPTRGVQPSPIIASTPGLCPVGEAVTGFTSTTVGTTTTYAWGCGTSTFGGLCQATYTSSLTNFDLSLKKYVNNINQDAQDGFPVAFGTGTTFNYIIRVTNNGAAGVSGITTVSDPGPATGVNFTGTPSGTGWNCTLSGRAISCTSNSTIASGANFPDITVPATTTNALGTFRNLATVANPNENPINNFGNNNSDEANVIVTAISGVCTPGTTTGVQTTAVTVTTAGLCPAGQAVGGFTSTTVGTTTNYSWSCNGSPVGGLCVASFTPTAGVCTPGTTTGVQATAVTATTAGLCPAGQAVGDFTSTTVGTTTNYSWSCNGSPVGGLCVASFTPTVTPDICTSLTASVTSQTVSSYSSVLTCTAGTSARANPTFQINCGNGQIINAATGTCNYIAYGTNSAFCSVNGQTGTAIPNACRLNITSNPPGGGGPGTCQELSFTTLSNVNNILSVGMNCTATSAAQPNPTFEIDCGNGQTINGNTGICGYSLIGNTSFPYTATCRVNGSTQGAPSASPGIFAPGSCRQSISYSAGGPPPPGGGGGPSTYCGNGIIDSWTKAFDVAAQIPGATCTAVTRPETVTVNGITTTTAVFDHYRCVVTTQETCDAGWLNGSPLNNLYCVGCQTQNNVTTTNPSANPLMISYHPVDTTRPQGLTVSNYQWIVGNNVSVFDAGDRFSIASPYPTILSGYSATIENDSNLINPVNSTISNPFGNNECIGAGQIDFGAGPRNCTALKTLFSVAAGGTVTPAYGGTGKKYTGNTTSITVNAAADANPPLSPGSAVLQNNFTIGIGYLREPLKVRVARQAVSNTAGGNAYIGARTGYSVNAITNEFLSSIKTGNFVVTSSASSNSNALSGADSSSVTNTSQNLSVGSNGSVNVARDVNISTMGDFNFANFAKMGDAGNIYNLKKGTVTITGDIRLKGIGTLLIEEGTLVINGNITYEDANSSWAFIVVKPSVSGMYSGTSIQIKNTVETISGVYMALAGEMTGSAASIVQLSVDGNVYANIGSLVNSRTFIRATEGSSALSTGVTINYSTRAFKNPPPLLSKYLEQYTLRKISR